MGFPDGSVVKNLPAMQETWDRSLGWKDPLEKGMVSQALASLSRSVTTSRAADESGPGLKGSLHNVLK